MVILRCLYRIAAILLWSALMALLSIPCQFRNRWKDIKEVSHVTQLWSKGLARIVGVRVKVSGPIPQAGGGLLVSNHLSYLDIIIDGSVLPVRYSAKADIAKWPGLGWYIGLSKPIWTDRNSKQKSKRALRSFTKTMKHGMYLIVYPEGTSSDGKHGILPFKSTSFEAAIIGNAPIIPALIRYKEIPGRPTVCWYGDMTLLPHIWQVLKLPHIKAELRFLDPIYPDGRSRKELADFVHKTMSRQYKI